MKIVEPSVTILTPINGQEILRHIERCGRVCYKSEDQIGEGSAEKFVQAVIRRGHESVLEHFAITVLFVTDRGISHEIVRHRIASYSQESTRYCSYDKDRFGREITVIKPCGIKLLNGEFAWKCSMEAAEHEYFRLLDLGYSPQVARAVLPTCLKTELVMTANLREWRHFIKLRAAKDAHPDIRRLALELWAKLGDQIPVIFDNMGVEV